MRDYDDILGDIAAIRSAIEDQKAMIRAGGKVAPLSPLFDEFFGHVTDADRVEEAMYMLTSLAERLYRAEAERSEQTMDPRQ